MQIYMLTLNMSGGISLIEISGITSTRDIKHEKIHNERYFTPGPKEANCSLARQSIYHVSNPVETWKEGGVQ